MIRFRREGHDARSGVDLELVPIRAAGDGIAHRSRCRRRLRPLAGGDAALLNGKRDRAGTGKDRDRDVIVGVVDNS